jgi:hypothetical protein
MPAGSLINGVQDDQVILDDFRQGSLDAGRGHVDQHVDAGEKAVDVDRFAEVTEAYVFPRVKRREGSVSSRGTKLHVLPKQGGAQETPDLAARTGKRDLIYAHVLTELLSKFADRIGLRLRAPS